MGLIVIQKSSCIHLLLLRKYPFTR